MLCLCVFSQLASFVTAQSTHAMALTLGNFCENFADDERHELNECVHIVSYVNVHKEYEFIAIVSAMNMAWHWCLMLWHWHLRTFVSRGWLWAWSASLSTPLQVSFHICMSLLIHLYVSFDTAHLALDQCRSLCIFVCLFFYIYGSLLTWHASLSTPPQVSFHIYLSLLIHL